MLKSAVSGGFVPLPQGLSLADGAEVLVLPLSWLGGDQGDKMRTMKTKSRPSFASEDLVGCYEGSGIAATNAQVRARLQKKRS